MPLSVCPRRGLDKAQAQRISELITGDVEHQENTIESVQSDEVILAI